MKEIDLGVVEITLDVEKGRVRTLHFNHVENAQNFFKDLSGDIPDGSYKWKLVLDVGEAEKSELPE